MVARTANKRRALWLTDIHLEFLMPQQIDTFLETVSSHQPDVILISGDIGQARPLRSYLLYMAKTLRVPICFVLGNHDFYGSDIDVVRDEMRTLTQQQLGPAWLPAVDLVELGKNVGLIGHDGWSDGRYGDYQRSELMLNDYLQIKSFTELSKPQRLERLKALGDEAADYLREVLPRALTHYQHIVILVHPPPFLEAFWHEGKPTKATNPFVPHFTSKAIGDLLLATAEANTEHQFTVLCGHTHGQASAEMRSNLIVHCGGAEYRHPEVQRVFEFEI